MDTRKVTDFFTGSVLKQYHDRLYIVQLTQDLTAVIEVIDNKIARSQADFSFKQSLQVFKRWKKETLTKIEVKDGKENHRYSLQGGP